MKISIKKIKQIAFYTSLSIVMLSIIGCDPMYMKQYDVLLLRSENMINPVQIEIKDSHVTTALFLIDGVAKKHELHMKQDACSLREQQNEFCRFYVGVYRTQGLISTSQKGLSLYAVIDKKTLHKMTIIITDEFRATQSHLSMKIENDLIEIFTKHYGEKAISLIK